ncbi:MAG: M20/M25/M40 family metallo-hydrolase [Myxococcales bacterium]|nr:M20/M25/M40 family metallo-hydrolase [Myxococcales bacterium]
MNDTRSARIPPAFGLTMLALCAGCPRGGGSAAPEASPATAVDAAVAGIRGEDLAAHVRVLASDAFEGRFPGSAGEAKTVAYLSAHLAAHGFEPVVDGSYLQPVPLVSVTLRPDTGATLTGASGPRALRVPDELVIGSPTPRARVELSDAEVVFAGHGIVAPEYGWDDYAGVDVRGKVVVVLPGDPGPQRADREIFEGRALSLHGTTAHKAELAAARGAAALLVLHDDAVGVPWDVFAQGARLPHQQLEEGSGAAKVALQGMIPRSVLAGALDDEGRRRLEALQRGAIEDGFTARPLPLRLSISLAREVAPVVSHNVVGVLPGARRPHEHVIYTAHWDHVGRGDERDGDGIYNGAVDNATGTAALLELAEAFGSLPQRPDRSIVLVATTAEEQGLLGSTWYAEHPVLPLVDAVGVINMDALFPFGETRGMTVVALGSSELDDYLADAARTVGRTLQPDPSPELGAFFRSDHYPFAYRGVPAIFAVGGPAPGPGEAAELEPYVEFVTTRYHQVGDEYDEATWDMGGIVQDTVVYFRAGHALAMDERRPQWSPGSPFRARHQALRTAATTTAAR